MKKLYPNNIKILCRILFLWAISMLLVSCANWILENPSFTLRGVSLRPISFTETNLLLDLDVRNPNNYDLTLKSFVYTISLKDEDIGNGHLEKEILIPSSSTTQIRVPLVVKFKDFNKTLNVIFTGDDLPYKIEGNARVGSIFGSLNFPFSTEGRINLKN
ncbi:MAG: LEA type 2 family protein [Deltaproteobacteria bacterium]